MALIPVDPDAPEFTRRYLNLADAALGALAIASSDDFFGPRQRMLDPTPPVFIAGKYDDHGKWMDGWETRRRRSVGHDWCVVKLARPGLIHGIDLDTSHFTGNFPPAASLEAAFVGSGEVDSQTQWIQLVPPTTLQGNQHHYLAVQAPGVVSHLRLQIYPDGGIARLRVYGQPRVEWDAFEANQVLDLAAAEHGARVVAANNQHFGLAATLLKPGRGQNMGDGWETRRRREPGNDWCIIELAHAGVLQRIEVDTAHFKGNYPDRCSLQAAYVTGATDASIVTQAMFWPELLGEQKLQMDHLHGFDLGLANLGPVTHVRLNIFPDGGVSRLHLFGVPTP